MGKKPIRDFSRRGKSRRLQNVVTRVVKHYSQLSETAMSEADRVTLAEKVETSICRIKMLDCNGSSCQPVGTGSGFVLKIDEQIIVATCDHVAGTPDRVRVFFADGRQFDGEVIATNPVHDNALIRLPEEAGVTHLALAVDEDGNPVEAIKGQTAFAFGHPLALGTDDSPSCFTFGMVTDPLNPGELANPGGHEVAHIQHQTPINGGNSGGPLLNSSGDVIGINAAAFMGADGVNLATPLRYLTELIASTRADTRRISFGGANFTDSPHGILIRTQSDDHQLSQFGVRYGERGPVFDGKTCRVSEVNGQPVKYTGDIARILAKVNADFGKKKGLIASLFSLMGAKPKVELTLVPGALSADPAPSEQRELRFTLVAR